MARILLVDDHPLFRQALTAVLGWAEPNFEIEEADTLKKACTILGRQRDVELILLDLKLPDSEGFAGLLTLRSAFPQPSTIVISATSDPETIKRAMSFGAAGFIAKSSTHTEIASAIKCVLAGDVWAPVSGVEAKSPLASSIASLTPSQLRILTSLKRGLLNKQIAVEMGISIATVKSHMAEMFRRLGVTNRTQAAMLAQALDLPVAGNDREISASSDPQSLLAKTI